VAVCEKDRLVRFTMFSIDLQISYVLLEKFDRSLRFFIINLIFVDIPSRFSPSSTTAAFDGENEFSDRLFFSAIEQFDSILLKLLMRFMLVSFSFLG
jgi:hypothetical protein